MAPPALRALGAKDGIYVAYNRSTADQAKRSFSRNVSCSTAHSLAFRTVGRRYAARLNGPKVPARRAAEFLGLVHSVEIATDLRVDAVQAARLALETVDRYCHSASDDLEVRHVPKVPGLEDAAQRALATEILPIAQRAWNDITRTDGKLRFSHDNYLKIWALDRPDLDTEFVLYDEAQDANPVIAKVVTDQDSQLIAVGDANQAIYGWRGAVDAMRSWPADRRLQLTQSWRFGPGIAAEANKWLSLLDTELRLTGTPSRPSRLGSLDRPVAVLCRINAQAMLEAMIALDQGQRTALVGGGAAIKNLAYAAIDLQAPRPTSHPELFLFRNWDEVREYVRHDERNGDLATFVRLIDDHGPDAIIDAAERLSDERRAQITISTAHKAKGREWSSVRIAEDFRDPGRDPETGLRRPLADEEAMLAYVAVTRASEHLDRSGLAWIDDLATPPPVARAPDLAKEPVSWPRRCHTRRRS